MWEHFHHQADIGIRGMGDSLSAAFEEGAAALMGVICDPATVEEVEVIEISCEADDNELLFADWINAIIYEMDVRKVLFGRFEVCIDGCKLTGKAWGEPADPVHHDVAVEVKAATFMELKVYEDEQGKWIAQCVVDV